MKKVITVCLVIGIFLAISGMAQAGETVTFTAADIVSTIGSLHDASNQWGLWAVRAMPIVTGGSYTITGGSTNQAGWGVDAPNSAFGSAPYTAANSVWFWDASGAEVPGNPPNPLYMIMDKPANTFTSYFGNTVTAVDETASYSFSFDLGVGASWTGAWQFVVDGSKYTLGTESSPGQWVADFFGGYGSGGSLPGNMGSGYAVVPVPGAILLGGIGVTLVGWLKKRRSL